VPAYRPPGNASGQNEECEDQRDSFHGAFGAMTEIQCYLRAEAFVKSKF
jgi:hypothetical protein